MNTRLRQFAELEYGCPRRFLAALRELDGAVAASPTAERIRTLRTNLLKPEREKRDAAIFCVGMSQRLGVDVLLAPTEHQDFDFVATWLEGKGTRHFCPVQLKEVVPLHLNANATVQSVVDGLTYYADSADVTVAIKINQQGRFNPAGLKLPANLRIGGLWIFAALDADQFEFGLWGDFLNGTDETLETAFFV